METIKLLQRLVSFSFVQKNEDSQQGNLQQENETDAVLEENLCQENENLRQELEHITRHYEDQVNF